MKKTYIILILIAMIALAAFLTSALDTALLGSAKWGLFAALIGALICLAMFLEFDSAAISSKEVALIAMLGTVSAVARVPFAAIPSVQPCTYLIICSGYVFGPVAGLTVGAITPLVSNFFLGHGPWTLYQMIAWGFAGLSAGLLNRFRLNRFLLIAFGLLWGYLYGCITNVWVWTAFVYPLSWKTFVVTELNSIWFDTFHAIGNAVFLGTLGMKTIVILNRFKQRFSIAILR
jgi:energy-coupling factor transport system substrate-specific component